MASKFDGIGSLPYHDEMGLYREFSSDDVKPWSLGGGWSLKKLLVDLVDYHRAVFFVGGILLVLSCIILNS